MNTLQKWKVPLFIALILFLSAAVCDTTPLQQAIQDAQEEVEREITEQITQAINAWVEDTKNAIVDAIKPYIPTEVIDSVDYLFDEVFSPTLDPLVISGGALGDALYLYLDKNPTTVGGLGLVTGVWSALNWYHDTIQCFQSGELTSQTCVSAVLDTAGIAVGAAAIVGAGIVSPGIIIAAGAVVTVVQFINNVLKSR